IGEIEALLDDHPQISEAVVVAREDRPGDKRLVACLVSDGEKLESSQLREYLGGRLPDYMIPSNFVYLDSLPLTPSGKIDRRALLLTQGMEIQGGSRFVAPRNELEKELVEIWQQVLGLQDIGIDDNFFDLGVHSLLALRLIGQIYKHFDKELPLSV